MYVGPKRPDASTQRGCGEVHWEWGTVGCTERPVEPSGGAVGAQWGSRLLAWELSGCVVGAQLGPSGGAVGCTRG